MAERQEIIIQTRLGEQAVDADRVIEFPKGLIGFEDKHRFVLLQIREDSIFMMLQSADEPGFGLVVADPYAFLEDFELSIGDAEQKILQAKDVTDLAVLVTVTIPRGRPDHTTLNLTGPVLVNTAKRIGLQVPQTDPRYPSHYTLNLEQPEEGEDQGQDQE